MHYRSKNDIIFTIDQIESRQPMKNRDTAMPADSREIELIDPSYQPSAAELAEDLRVDATFEELTAAVLRPVKVRYVKPQRKR